MKNYNQYEFTVKITGWGVTPDIAWEDAMDSFDIEKEPLPEYEIIDSYEQDEKD